MTDEEIDWSTFGNDAAVVLERSRIESGDPWIRTDIAGLQFYTYDQDDGLAGVVRPQLGDRLTLVRRADNPADRNAVEVWWKNEHMLGHLPRHLAAAVAGKLDHGESLRGYVWNPGNGKKWSMIALLVGEPVETLHDCRVRRWFKDTVKEASEAVWGTCDLYESSYGPIDARDWLDNLNTRLVTTYRRDLARIKPTPRQQQAVQAFEDRFEAARLNREAAAIYAFHLIPNIRPEPPENLVPDEALRGTTFAWWDDVPEWLTTKTKLRELGLKPTKGGTPFAAIEYTVSREWRRFDLWAIAEADPLRPAPPETAARSAEAAFWRRPIIEAKRAEREEYYQRSRQARW